MRNVALRIEYDGTDFVGSQWQNNGRSVQGALESAWEQLTGERRRITLAGRTDAGVHARGQVANVRTETRHDLTTIVRGLNGILPEDVAVLEGSWVALEFHARHTAIRRDYRYVIDNGPVAAPLLRQRAAHAPRPLDTAAMNRALEPLLGQHDFAAFSDGPQEGSTVRICYAAHCERTALWEQPVVTVDIAANAFLRHMVRNIVGTLLLVGEGRLGMDGLAAVLADGGRRRPRPLAPAHGLYLMSVSYPDEIWGTHTLA
ncbi:MAG TPA: tRNA pseudouridine(38-40) synthase TruA [Roseiflexaceae bacterium]|nr:tRNA pseudouridine(38-40) synthase TruA [Roseiflexaceae bacterium]